MNYKKITLDTERKSFESIVAMQGDNKSRYIKATIVNKSIPLDLTGCAVKFSAIKPDMTDIFNDAVITNATLGEVEIELTNQTLAVPGVIQATLVILKEDMQLSVLPFFITVIENPYNPNAIESKSEYKALNNALTTAEGYAKELQDASVNLEEKYTTRLNNFGEQLDTIAYLLPPSNGVDDTETIQNAINNYKKVQLNGVHIISNLTVNNDVEIIGKNKRSDILRQKSGSTGNAITSNGLLSLNNITVKGNNEANCSGVVYSSKSGEAYSGTGNINNCEILNFKDYGIKLEGNRNMLHAYEIGITTCGTGLYIESSDNLLSKLNIGDCNINIKVKKGGGNVFESCALYRSNEYCIWLGHEAYYSSFSNTSIDTNKKQSVYIKQVDTNVNDRGHKFVGCSFFGNSSLNSGVYNCFDLDGAKGVIIQACNFFVYDEVKVKYLVNITNGGYAIMQGNLYATNEKKPYTTSVVNDKTKVSILDFENNIFNSNISMQSGKKIGFNSPDAYTQILQSFVNGDSYARLQIYSDGRIIFGNGNENPKVRFEISNNDALKLANGSLLLGTGKTIGVGNSAVATTPRNVVAKFEILNENGVSLGYVPIYDRID